MKKNTIRRNILAQQKGFRNNYEYQDSLAKKRGFIDIKEYQRQLSYDNKIALPMSKNKECPAYLGIFLSERVLSKVFESVTRMPNNNVGYDFICKNDFKIDVKSACLQKYKANKAKDEYKVWKFNIRHNKIADYFLLLAFNNRTDLEPQHIWLIKGTELIREKEINECHYFTVFNTAKAIERISKYELKDKLECVKKEVLNTIK